MNGGKSVRCAGLSLAARIGLCAVTTLNIAAQSGANHSEWSTYGADLASTRYAPLDQINASNFNELQVAWRFKADNLGPHAEFNFQATPLMVNGTLYSTGGSRRAVVALDAGTGELRWIYSENEGKRGESAPRQLSGRGLAYWTNGSAGRADSVRDAGLPGSL